MSSAGRFFCSCHIKWSSEKKLMVLSLLRYVSGQFFYINLFIDLLLSQRVIHKPRGLNFGHFDPLSPSWSLLLNKSYVIKWSFGQTPSPLNWPRGLWMTPKLSWQSSAKKNIWGFCGWNRFSKRSLNLSVHKRGVKGNFWPPTLKWNLRSHF